MQQDTNQNKKMKTETAPLEKAPVEDSKIFDMVEDTSMEPAERKRLRRSPRTKKILYNSVMLLVTFANQIATQANAEALEQVDPPAVAQLQAVDQEKLQLPDEDEAIEASGEETPLTEAEIAAKEVAEYPFRTEAPDSYHPPTNDTENVILELKRGNGVNQEDEAA